MVPLKLTDQIAWRIHLSSPPEKVFDLMATDAGRSRFWASRTSESAGTIRFEFSNGSVFETKVLAKSRPERFAIEYFGGSRVNFDLISDGAGGTDLTMTESNVPESNVPESNRLVHYAGWVSVLLSLKAAADFSVDLRSNDPKRTWEHGYVDV